LTFTAERESAANNTPQAIALQKHQNEGGKKKRRRRNTKKSRKL
jgi:hypothetical protein